MIRWIYSDTISWTYVTLSGHFSHMDLGPPERWSGRFRGVLWHGRNIIMSYSWCVRRCGSLWVSLRPRTSRSLWVDILHTRWGDRGIRSYLRVPREGSDHVSESPLVQSGDRISESHFENFRNFPKKFSKLSIKKSKIFNDFKKNHHLKVRGNSFPCCNHDENEISRF